MHYEGRVTFVDCVCGWIIDLSHAYYHISMDKRCWKYMCFRWKGKVYCYTCLCFGITSAPQIFTMIIACIVGFWRREYGMRTLPFIDDLTSGALCPRVGAAQAKFQIAHLKALGWIIQMKKFLGVPEPLVRLPSLGTVISFDDQKFWTDSEKLAAVKLLARANLKKKKECARTLAILPGMIMSIMVSIGVACRIRTRGMYANLLLRWESTDDKSNVDDVKRAWKRTIPVLEGFKEECQWWLLNVDKLDGKPIAYLHPPMVIDCTYTSDTSETGYGGFFSLPDDWRFDRANAFLSNLA